VTGDEHFARLAEFAARWFLGENDTGALMLDPETGGGCDGLERHGRKIVVSDEAVNVNDGALEVM
jgi:hypothetical protein